MKRPFRRQFRLQASLLMLALQSIAAVIHLFSGLVYASTTLVNTTRVVAQIQGLTHTWVLLFGFTSIYLGVTLWRNKREVYGHLACATVWVAYSTGLWVGAIFAAPHGTVFWPIVATFIASFHTLLASTYNFDLVGGGPRQ